MDGCKDSSMDGGKEKSIAAAAAVGAAPVERKDMKGKRAGEIKNNNDPRCFLCHLFSFHSSIHLSAAAMAATGGKARQGKKEVLDGGKNDVRYYFLSHLLFFPSCLFFPQTRRRQRQRQRYFSLFLHPSNYPYIHPSIHPSAALAGAAGINNIGGRRRKVSK